MVLRPDKPLKELVQLDLAAMKEPKQTPKKPPKEKPIPLSPKEKFGLSIRDAVQLSSLGETSISEALKDKRLRSRKFGTRVVIMPADLTLFLENLPLAD
jgi:hypothetical protein